MYNCNKCVSQLFHFFLQMNILFCSCVIFLASVLFFCMIPMNNYAVVPFFAVVLFIFALVHLFLMLYNLLPDPILVDCRSMLKHKHMASLAVSRYVRL
jgi:hypothetical protein